MFDLTGESHIMPIYLKAYGDQCATKVEDFLVGGYARCTSHKLCQDEKESFDSRYLYPLLRLKQAPCPPQLFLCKGAMEKHWM